MSFDKSKIMIRLKYALKFLPDELYVRLYYRLRVKRKLNLERPKTFNEKLQWLKFNDRDPQYSIVVDKYTVRKYISETIGEEYLIPLIGVWDKFDEIDFSKLPEKFVIKCNHDSGGIVICTDKSKLNIDKARKIINKSLKRQFYYVGREWQYKNIQPKIICEKFIGENDIPPADYKISCFNGVVDNIMICLNRFSKNGNKADYFYFDKEWDFIPYNKNDKSLKEVPKIKRPDNLDEMISIAEVLAKEYYYARIDLYNDNGKIYFGEITLCPNSGFDADISFETDLLFGEKLEIPTIDYI